MGSPTISVILPVFNSELFISNAIDSILNQTFEDFELIVVNDGSTDRTKDIILSKRDKRLVYIENRKNQGIVKSLNKGIYFSNGQFVARMDADDISLPKRFEIQMDYIKCNKHISILSSNFIYSGSQEKTSYVTKNELHRIYLLKENTIAHPTVLFNKKIMKNNNLYYDKLFPYTEDYKLWIDSSVCGLEIETISEPLLIYNDVLKSKLSFAHSDTMMYNAECLKIMYGHHCFGDTILKKQDIYFRLINGILFNNDKQNQEVVNLGYHLISLNESSRYFDLFHFKEMIEKCISIFE